MKLNRSSEKTVGVLVLFCILVMGVFAVLFNNGERGKPVKEKAVKTAGTENKNTESEPKESKLTEKMEKVKEMEEEMDREKREAEKLVKKKRIGNFKYAYVDDSNDGIWITKITPISEKDVSTLSIPAEIDGKKVLKLGDITDDDVNYFEKNLFPGGSKEEVAEIKKIIIPNKVQEITPNCFTEIQNGKVINIPKGITKNVIQLCGVKWKEFNVSPENEKYKVQNGLLLSKDGKVAYGSVVPLREVVIPEGVKQIERKSDFNSKMTTDFYIPASLDKIGYESLHMSKVVKFHVSAKNKHYAEADDCVYSKKTGRLVVASVKSSIFTVPKQVTLLENTDFAGKQIKEFVIPKEVQKIASFWCPFDKDVTYVFEGKIPPLFEDAFAFENVEFYVPEGCKEVYKKAVEETEKSYGKYSEVVRVYETVDEKRK